jgi:predicted Zn-dependent protease
MPRIIPASLLAVCLFVGCSYDAEPDTPTITLETKTAALDSAMQHLNAGRTVEALAITSKLILRDPNSIDTLEKHAIVLLAEAARVETLGESAIARTRREEALEAYIAVCTHQNVRGETQFSAAQLAHMLGEIELAISLYKQSHEKLMHDGRSALWLAQIDLLSNNWSEANYWITQSLTRNPKEPTALISAGLIQANLGDCENALLSTKSAIRMQPNNQNFRLMQARVLRICGDPERAIEILSSLTPSQVVRDEIELCKEIKVNHEH